MALASLLDKGTQVTAITAENGQLRWQGRAVRIHGFADFGRVCLEPVDYPAPDKRKLLVRVHAAALNRRDILQHQGRVAAAPASRLPLAAGFEFCGEVLARGRKASRFQVGDRVFGLLDPNHGGACAELLEVDERQVASAPDGISAETLAAVPFGGLTAYQALHRIGRVRPGQSICINGGECGLGSLAIQIARLLGCLVIARSRAEHFEHCRRLGAHCTLDLAAPLPEGEHEFDLFFDVTGEQSLRRVRRVLAPDGLYVTTRTSTGNYGDQLRTATSLGRRARLVRTRHRRSDLEWLRHRLQEGVLIPAIERCYRLDEIQQAYRQLEAAPVLGKIVIRCIKS